MDFSRLHLNVSFFLTGGPVVSLSCEYNYMLSTPCSEAVNMGMVSGMVSGFRGWFRGSPSLAIQCQESFLETLPRPPYGMTICHTPFIPIGTVSWMYVVVQPAHKLHGSQRQMKSPLLPWIQIKLTAVDPQ